MTTPLIGIEVDLEANPSGRRYAKCYEAYFDRIVDAGGAPILLPPAPVDVLRRLLGELSGVVIPGGDDFHAKDWGEAQRPCERFTPSDTRRLESGRSLIELVLSAGLPFLGVCYGAQLLNLHLGGTLVQDIPDEVPSAHDHRAPHGIDVLAGSLLHRLAGDLQPEVNSRHHQSVRDPGRGLQVCATSSDGVVEAVEAPDAPFLLGVQWHPEELEGGVGAGLFDALVVTARDFSRHAQAIGRAE